MALPSPAAARTIRLAAGVSQQRLADELGVHPLTVARWEEGLFRPNGRSRRAYVELLAALKAAAAR